MELEKADEARAVMVFETCNAYLKALLSKDKTAIETALKAYDSISDENKTKCKTPIPS